MDDLPLGHDGTGVCFEVRVVPRARRTEAAGRRGSAIVIKLAAPPVDGAANDALIAFLSSTFGRPRRDVKIVSGLASRTKRVSIAGITLAEAAAALSIILPA